MTTVRLSIRALLRAPGFAAGAIVNLASGIAATTFIVAIVYGVLARPLPFADEDRLVTLANTIPRAGVGAFPFSLPEYVEHRDHNAAFASVAAYAAANVTVMHGATPERVAAARVTGNFFDVLGIRAVLGRVIEAADGAPGADCVVVLGHGYWRERLGGAPDAVGRPLVIDDRPCRIVGVTPADFRWPATADAWLPQAVAAAPSPAMLGRQMYRPIARLHDGVSAERAAADTRALAERFHARYPAFYSGAPWAIALTPIRDQVLGGVPAMLRLLAGAVALVFAIACGNVAQLMAGRMLSRDREFAIRLSLGAGRRHVLAALATESAVLAMAGGALGLWLAAAGLDAALAAGSIDLPRRESIAIDGPVLAWVLLATVIASATMALPSAIRMMRLRPVLTPHERFGPGPAVRRFRDALVAAQVALTMMLVVGAVLFLTSLQRLTGVAPGFDTRHLVVAQVSPPASRYPDAARSSALVAALLARVSSLPGVTMAGAVSALPLDGQDARASFTIDGWTPEQSAKSTEVHYRLVAGEYFRAMGMRLAHGRWPSASDGRGAAPIAIVNTSFARRFWPTPAGALGHRVSLDDGTTWHTVVGVMDDVKHAGLDAGDQIELFLPYEQAGTPAASMTLVLRTGLPLAPAAAGLRDAVAEVDPRLPLHAVRTMETVMAASVARPRLRVTITVLFAAMGLLLAAVGTFSVLAQLVGERTYEIAVRRALGAQARAIVSLVLARAVLVLGAGGAIGLAGAAALSRTVRSMLFGVAPTEPAVYAAAAATVLLVGLAACLVPVWRAVMVSPLAQLRAE